MYEIGKDDYKKLDSFFIRYEQFKQDLQLLEFQAMGGMAGGRIELSDEETESVMTQLQDNLEYRHKRMIVEAVEHTYNNGDDRTKEFINRRYWDEGFDSEFDFIAEEMGTSKSSILRFRHKILQRFADRIGWV